jgi:hypothetical protein
MRHRDQDIPAATNIAEHFVTAAPATAWSSRPAPASSTPIGCRSAPIRRPTMYDFTAINGNPNAIWRMTS